MTPNQKREEISKAYIATVAAKCGFKIGNWSQDDGCLDLTIGAEGQLGGPNSLRSPKLDIQLKCTNNQKRDLKDAISCPLTRSHYEKLQGTCTSHILVVLMLPKEEKRWVEHSVNALLVRRCAYWVSLRDASKLPDGQEKTTVHVPKSQAFSPKCLDDLLMRISKGELI